MVGEERMNIEEIHNETIKNLEELLRQAKRLKTPVKVYVALQNSIDEVLDEIKDYRKRHNI